MDNESFEAFKKAAFENEQELQPIPVVTEIIDAEVVAVGSPDNQARHDNPPIQGATLIAEPVGGSSKMTLATLVFGASFGLILGVVVVFCSMGEEDETKSSSKIDTKVVGTEKSLLQEIITPHQKRSDGRLGVKVNAWKAIEKLTKK